MPHRCLKTVLAAALSAAACSQPSLAQSPASTILLIDLENSVQYNEDISDPSRFATDPNVTTVAATRNFTNRTTMGDIVVVNGRVAKGTQLSERRIVSLSTSPAPGQAIADTIRNSIAIQSFEILQGDGTPIGSIFLSGLADSGAQPNKPPGAPSDQIMSNWAIVGGTGAFLSARGQAGEGTSPQPNGPPRQASYSEDPANRRRNGGSRTRWVHVEKMK